MRLEGRAGLEAGKPALDIGMGGARHRQGIPAVDRRPQRNVTDRQPVAINECTASEMRVEDIEPALGRATAGLDRGMVPLLFRRADESS